MPYFPGDPPAFEMLGMLSLILMGLLVVLGSLGFLVTLPQGLRRLRRPALRMTLVPISLLGILLMIAAVGISARHFGEWAELRDLIRHSSEIVGAEMERAGDSSQLAGLEMRLLNPAPTFKFKALREPVHLRIMQTTPPYVGVDFGNGANAVFDPLTMICLYSD